ncbi:MAG: antitoxin Xre-like helix-turn-helix domain-containing protein [Pseudomonadota bacterium]
MMIPDPTTPFDGPKSQDERRSLALMVTRLFDHWQLTTKDALMLLGLSTGNRAALAGYRKGKPLGNNRDLFDRVSYLLGIHKSLRLIFSKNRDLAYRWMSTPNRRLDDVSPVEFVSAKGLPGLAALRGLLDFERGR